MYVSHPHRLRESRAAFLFVVSLLVWLASLAQVQFNLAHLGIIWRVAVLSWDNPETQDAQDVATQVVPTTEPGREVYECICGAAREARSLLPPASDRHTNARAFAGRVTRAPPAA
jgi:hypothetical protein